jgi:menaquinone reductase, multiheme cytochrome c subunit
MQGWIPFLAGAAVMFGAGWAGFPRIIYKSSPQPVAFSHKVHAEKAGSKCEDCHAIRNDGSYAGIPALDKCSGCHSAAMGTTAAEKQFIDNYVTPAREPQWKSYARQPDNVYFPHVTHVKTAKLKCERCHGDQGSTDQLRPHQVDRISGYSRDIWGGAGRPGMTMNHCVDCHSSSKLEHSCLDCHK